MPIFAAIPAVLTAVGSAVVGAGTAAAVGGLATGIIGAGTLGAIGFGIADAAGAFTPKVTAASSLINPNPTATPSQTVDNSSTSSSNVNNLGRAALIATSPQGVQGSDPSNRYALLGTSSGIT